jgi:putative DNA methylase
VDGPGRSYLFSRDTYRTTELDAGVAIVLQLWPTAGGAGAPANGTPALVEKRKGKYLLRDFAERRPLKKLCQCNPARSKIPLFCLRDTLP